MKKSILSLSILLAGGVTALAQPAIQWQFSYGGTENDGVSVGNAQHDQIEPTPDGGYIIAGFSNSNDGDVTGHHGLASTTDCWVAKLDSLGNLEWQRSLGGSGSEFAQCIKPTLDGGYILSANSDSNDGDVTGNHGSNDAWVVKLDSLGNIEWQRSLGGSSYDHGRSICVTPDGGYVLGTQTASNDGDVSGSHGSSDAWLVKLDAMGNIQWQKCIGGSKSEGIYAIRLTPDNGMVFAGETSSDDGDLTGTSTTLLGSAWICKTDSVGNIVWTKTYGGSSLDWGREVITTADGGYMLGVSTVSNDGNVSGNHGASDYWVLKLDAMGTLVWQRCYGGTSSELIKASRQTGDGGYIHCGTTLSNDGDITNFFGVADGWVVKTDSLGNIEWERCFGGSESDDITSVVPTADGGYILGGESNSNDFDVSGHHGPLTTSDLWVVKLGPNATGVAEYGTAGAASMTVSPVPAVDHADVSIHLAVPTRATVKVFGLDACEVATLWDDLLPAGTSRLRWEISSEAGLRDGAYLVRVITDASTTTQKIIIVR